jgi:CRISPR-associated Cas5-like protein
VPVLDTVIDNGDIAAVRLVRHRWWGGIGLRSDMRGTVAIVTALGQVAEFELKVPVRLWAIPRVWGFNARKLRLSIRNPEKLVERFSAPVPTPRKVAAIGAGRKRRR